MEWHKYLDVGTFLKEPVYPIWIICKEYHYSLIFGLNSQIIMQS